VKGIIDRAPITPTAQQRELRAFAFRHAIAKQGASIPFPCGAMIDHTPRDPFPDLYTCRKCGVFSRWRDWIGAWGRCHDR
jgi:hypothetical protein